MGKSKTALVYTFKVALECDTRIWRRIELCGDQTLDHLHWAIFHAFDREEEHLYSFYLEPPGGYRPRRPSRNAVEYTHPYSAQEGNPWSDQDPFDASQTTIDSLKLHHGRKFVYLFDFGDSWWHEITAERTDGVPTEGRYPRVIEEHGDSPPQYPDYDQEDGGGTSK